MFSVIQFKWRGFSSKAIPTLEGLPLIGTALSIAASGSAPHLHKYIHQRHKTLGPIFRENMGSVKAVFISDPTLMRSLFSIEGKYPSHFIPAAWAHYNQTYLTKRGLFFMEGEEWSKYRKIMNSYLLSNSFLSKLNNVHKFIVRSFVERWNIFNGREVEDLEGDFYKHSISFIIGSLMGDSFTNGTVNFQEDINCLAKTFQKVFYTSSKLNTMPFINYIERLRFPIWKEFESSVWSSMEASHRMLDKMRPYVSTNGLLHGLQNENIPEDTLTALVADLMLAAGDTTAYTSQWALYHLSQSKELQDQIVENPALVRAVIKETLRLYPPAVFISRYLPEDQIIGGYSLNKGELVLLSLYTAGRSESIYPDAEQFKPERWEKGESITLDGRYKGVTDPNAFIPFAMGTRSCVGARLATSQFTTTISEILSKYTVNFCEPVEMILQLVPVPSKPIRIKITAK